MPVCTTRAEIEAALAPGAEIIIASTVLTGSTPIAVPHNRVRFCGMGCIGALGDAFSVTGSQVYFDDLEIQAGGKGIIFSGLNHKVRGARITSSSTGIKARNGGGLELSGVHLNGHANGSRALDIGAWDTIEIVNLLTEQHGTGLRLGIDGGVANLSATNLHLDRCANVGVHIEPGTNGDVHQMQFSNLWVSFALYPFVADAALGPVRRIQVDQLMSVDCVNKTVVAQNGAQVTLGTVQHF